MMRLSRFALTLCFVTLASLASLAQAVQPDEVLDDTTLESRAREISAGLRCLVCQNESIDESNASLARDLRLLVRERLVHQKLEVVREVVASDAALPFEAQQRETIASAVADELARVSDAPREWAEIAAGLGVDPVMATEVSERADSVLAERANGNAQVVNYIVDRYGEFVLLRPTTGGWNWLLWAAGPILFLVAAGVGIAYIRRRSSAKAPAEAGLNEEERRRLKELLGE